MKQNMEMVNIINDDFLLVEEPNTYNKEFVKVKPFLKWAGGKSQMIKDILKFAPKTFNNYFEPFVGGGAVFFELNAATSIISDANEELINTYTEVQQNVDELIEILKNHSNAEEDYYRVRSLKPEQLSSTERAARVIYLNKLCYNGLYRVNKKGAFNVPYGKKTSPFLNEGTLRLASNYLAKTEIVHCDYKDILQSRPEKGDFIFLDPPYHPISANSDFKRYTKEFFYEKDQIELAELFKNLVQKGCYIMLTNSEHPFILDLYKDFEIKIIETRRLISSDPATRKGTDIIVLGGI